MQINNELNTYFTNEGYWILTNSEKNQTIFSNRIKELLKNLKIDTETLFSLIEKVLSGHWPLLLGGELFAISSLQISKKNRIISLIPSSQSEIADILQTKTGDNLFLLITTNSRVLVLSKGAENLFNSKTGIEDIFDSLSSGSIRSAISHSLKNSFVPDFLVSYNTKKREKLNFTCSIRKLPTIGKLFYCRLTKPSVALISQSSFSVKQVKNVLEDNFTPSIILDALGKVVFINKTGRSICSDMWGVVPLNENFVEFIHPSQKLALKLQYEKRVQNSVTNSHFTIKLKPTASETVLNAEIKIIPINNTNQHIIFINVSQLDSSQKQHMYENNSLTKITQLFSDNSWTPAEILGIAAKSLNATSAAYSKEKSTITVGDSRQLIEILNPIHLAASPEGFREDGIYIHRIHSGFGISHLVFKDIPDIELTQIQLTTLNAVSKVFSEREAWQALQSVYKILATVKATAKTFLNKTESLEGLLSDLANDCGAESVAIFRISADGLFLRGIAASGVIGKLPELPLESLNSATWACIRGETTFFSDTIGTELQFSPVFTASKSELAVPFFIGNSPDGVILISSTDIEAFNYSETELIELMGLLFTASTNLDENKVLEETQALNMLKHKALEYMIHNITSLGSSATRITDLMSADRHISNEIKSNIVFLGETTTRLRFFSKWVLWWLKISVYGGKPEPKWLEPTKLLENSLSDLRYISEQKQIKLHFYPPENDIEVCTDSSFVNMIAHSLLVCLLDYCTSCESISLSIKERNDYWTFSFETAGGSVPSKCYAIQKVPEKHNMAYTLAWKLIEELGGTINTLSNTGKSTKIMVRLKKSG